jgi:anthranilate phosphoribosyltransferase
MDEISTLGKTKIYRLTNGEIIFNELDPASLGIAVTNIDELRTGDAATNAKIVRDIIENRDKGPRKDIVLLNSAAAIIVAGLADDFESAMTAAEKSITDGKAADCLQKMIEISNS